MPKDARPVFMANRAGPSRQVSLLDFSIPGNTQIHRSNDSHSQITQSDRTHSRKTHDQCIIPDEEMRILHVLSLEMLRMKRVDTLIIREKVKVMKMMEVRRKRM